MFHNGHCMLCLSLTKQLFVVTVIIQFSLVLYVQDFHHGRATGNKKIAVYKQSLYKLHEEHRHIPDSSQDSHIAAVLHLLAFGAAGEVSESGVVSLVVRLLLVSLTSGVYHT